MNGSEGGQFIDMMHERGVLNSGESTDYALGVSHGEYRGAATVSHGGAWGGFRANLCRYPQQRLSIAVACNLVSNGCVVSTRNLRTERAVL